MRKFYLVSYIIAVLSIAIFLIATAHNGTESVLSVARPPSTESIRINKKLKAIVNGDTISFVAASEQRCDTLYKYAHCVGVGKIIGLNKWNYIYVKNDSIRLITIEQLIAEQNGKSKR